MDKALANELKRVNIHCLGFELKLVETLSGKY